MLRNWRLIVSTLLPCLLFWPLLFGQAIIAYDTNNIFYVGKRWFFAEVLSGRFPLWNEHVFMGFNSLSSPAGGYLSPVSALFYLIFPSYWAEQLQLPLFAALAGAGMYLWIVRITRSESAATLAATGFGLSGLLMSLPDRSHHFFALALYPWAAWCSVRLKENLRWGNLAGLSFVLAMIVIHADWTGALMIGIVLLLTAQDRAHALRISAAGVWALAAASLTVVPVLLGLDDTSRNAGFSLEQTSHYSLHPLRLLNLFLPEAWGETYAGNFFGQSIANSYKGERFWFHSIYLGLPVLLLAGLGWRTALEKKFRWVTVLVLATVAIAFGQYFFAHEILYKFLPGYSGLRFPEKFIVYMLFGLLTLAAVTVPRVKDWKPIFAVASGLHVVAFLTYFLWPALGAHVSLKFPLLHLLLAAAYTAGALRFPLASTASALLATELLLFAPVMNWGPGSELEQRGSIAENLQAGRFVRDANLEATSNFRPRRTLQANWGILERARDVFGYDTITPARIEKIKGKSLFQNLDSWIAVLNLTQVLTPVQPRATDLKRFAESGFLQIAKLDEELNTVLLRVPRPSRDFIAVCRHENVQTDDEALEKLIARGNKIEPLYIEGENSAAPATPNGTPCDAQIQARERRPEFRSYEIESAAPIWFVERERFTRDWEVQVDGQNARLHPADFLNRAVYLSPGKHVVELRYRPKGLGIGAALSALAFLGFLIVFISQSLAHFRKTE